MRLAGVVLGMVASMLLAGCKTDMTRWLNPSEVIKAPEKDKAPVISIKESITVADVTPEMPPNATFPTEDDLQYSEKDYVIGPTDIMNVSVMDLFAEGMETVLQRQVSDSGFISLPLLSDPIKAKGLTQDQLRDAIVRAYSPGVLREPTVSVTIVAQRQNTFSAIGAIARPGKYNIDRKDMRLLEAIALAGGITTTNIRYIYVIRPPAAIVKPESQSAAASAPSASRPAEAAAPAAGAAPAPGASPAPGAATGPAGAQPAPADSGLEAALRELGQSMSGPASAPAGPAKPPQSQPGTIVPHFSENGMAAASASSSATSTTDDELTGTGRTYKWVYADGRWIRAAQDAPVAAEPSGAGAATVRPAGVPPQTQQAVARRAEEEDIFGWKKAAMADSSRVIAINLFKLRDGDPRMNIVVRDNDVINVPVLEMGEFYVMGQVLRPGVYSLTGRKITVKMAVAAAGNLAPLAWPENSILIRRVGDNQEQMVPLNIEAIIRGEALDVYLKPDDVIAVGTHISAPFLAVLREAFRMTYGFGFIYDRNFSDPLLVTPDRKRFLAL